MELFASTDNGEIVSATKAHKQQNYLCLECRSPVRVKRGPHIQSHFFHLTNNRHCSQNKKSATHLAVQCYLEQLIPNKEGKLEVPFMQGKRIADVVWPQKKLIFEVQCSPITAEEVAARNRDYNSLGYEVIWIFHDRRFNKRRLSAAELFLQYQPRYYTNINKEGKGIVYDIYRSPQGRQLGPFTVHLHHPIHCQPDPSLPLLIQHRLQNRSTAFQGDLISRVASKPDSSLARACSALTPQQATSFSLQQISAQLKRILQALFYCYLEKFNR